MAAEEIHGTPDHASALIVKVPERNLTFLIFANSDQLGQPFNLLRGSVLNSPAALLFLRMIVFPGEELAEIAAKEAATRGIILKASGQRPLLSPFQTGLLVVGLLTFITAPMFWLAGWVLRKKRRWTTTAPNKFTFGSGASRVYALASRRGPLLLELSC